MELIIYILIAVLVMYRLYSVLGHTKDLDEEGGERYVDAFVEDVLPRVGSGSMPAKSGAAGAGSGAANEDAIEINVDAVSRDNLIAMGKIDKGFTLNKFIRGVEVAFDMMFQAYKTYDVETIDSFIDGELLAKLKARINSMKARCLQNKSVIVSSKPLSINSVVLKGTVATIEVIFNTEQVVLIENDKQEKISGDAKNIIHVRDVWLLRRDMVSRDPNWRLISME